MRTFEYVVASACYGMLALIPIFVVAMTTSHCPEPECAARALRIQNTGGVIALVLYPLFLTWLRRNMDRRG